MRRAEGVLSTPPAPRRSLQPSADRSHPMIALNGAVADAPRPPRTRSPRKAGDQATRPPAARLAKSKDASMGKASFYLPGDLLKKLVVASVIRGVDQSDIVASLLARELSSVTYYDRATRPADSTLMVTEIGSEATG